MFKNLNFSRAIDNSLYEYQMLFLLLKINKLFHYFLYLIIFFFFVNKNKLFDLNNYLALILSYL